MMMAWPTREQIAENMAIVRQLALREAERAQRRRELAIDLAELADENSEFFTGACHVCGTPVGPRQRWCSPKCYEHDRYKRNRYKRERLAASRFPTC
jgi:Uncharacterized protein containing a Zn-ribbon (DUF2116)